MRREAMALWRGLGPRQDEDPLARDPLPQRGDRRGTRWSEMPQTQQGDERGENLRSPCVAPRRLAVKTNVELPGLVGGLKRIELSDG